MTNPPTPPVPDDPAARAGLDAIVTAPGSALIAADFDGTLAPLVPDPADSRLAAGGLDALRSLASVVCRVVIITGRAAATVVELGDLDQVPNLVVYGQYGAERWHDGDVRSVDHPPGIDKVRARLPALVASADPGVWIEDKGLSLVLHTRRTPDPDGQARTLLDPVRDLAEAHGLRATLGRYVVEVRLPGHDKGAALRRAVDEYRPGAVLFAGDDLGDLPAFDTVRDLRAAGTPGLSVCGASTEAPEIADHADLAVDGPEGVVRLFAALAVSVRKSPR